MGLLLDNPRRRRRSRRKSSSRRRRSARRTNPTPTPKRRRRSRRKGRRSHGRRRRTNPFRLPSVGGVGAAVRAGLPIAGSLWAGDFLQQFITDRVPATGDSATKSALTRAAIGVLGAMALRMLPGGLKKHAATFAASNVAIAAIGLVPTQFQPRVLAGRVSVPVGPLVGGGLADFALGEAPQQLYDFIPGSYGS